MALTYLLFALIILTFHLANISRNYRSWCFRGEWTW